MVKERAFSLVEVMLAGVIFTIAVAGVFASIASVKTPVNVSSQSVIAANCGQQVLENLRARVDARDWASGDLSLVTHTPTFATLPCSAYGFSYVVTDAGNGARKVALSVTWTP